MNSLFCLSLCFSILFFHIIFWDLARMAVEDYHRKYQISFQQDGFFISRSAHVQTFFQVEISDNLFHSEKMLIQFCSLKISKNFFLENFSWLFCWFHCFWRFFLKFDILTKEGSQKKEIFEQLFLSSECRNSPQKTPYSSKIRIKVSLFAIELFLYTKKNSKRFLKNFQSSPSRKKWMFFFWLVRTQKNDGKL